MDNRDSAFQQGLLLKTKLYLPPVRPNWVSRPRLIERLNEGMNRKLTLISAPAGYAWKQAGAAFHTLVEGKSHPEQAKELETEKGCRAAAEGGCKAAVLGCRPLVETRQERQAFPATLMQTILPHSYHKRLPQLHSRHRSLDTD